MLYTSKYSDCRENSNSKKYAPEVPRQLQRE